MYQVGINKGIILRCTAYQISRFDSCLSVQEIFRLLWKAKVHYHFKFCKSVHHHTILINQPTRCNISSSLLLDFCVQLNMFWASSSLSSGVQQLQKQPLVLPLERGGSSTVGRSRACPTTTNSTAITPLQRKTRGRCYNC